MADRLAHYAAGLSYRDLPPAVVHEVKRRLLDSLACAFGAWSVRPCTIARRVAESVKIRDGATVWGTGHQTLPDLATFANGAHVRYLDFNDTYLSLEPAHPSDNLAAVVAAAEPGHASGKEVITAVALAYEIHCRLCDAAALRPRGWDHVTYGPFSSALGAAKIMGLSEKQMREAVNLAGVANVALRQTRVGDLSMWKACAFSNAARNGVFAAQLAREGMVGPSPIFEGEKGFMKLVSGPFDLPPLAGEPVPVHGKASFMILDTYIKHFPVEYHAQTAVEAALAMRAELQKKEGAHAVANIAEIEIGSYDVAIEIIGRDPEKWRPTTRETADHSFPYCVAVALLDGKVNLHSFSPKRLHDPGLHELMQKVRVVREPAFIDQYPHTMPTRLRVTLTSGKEYVKQVDVPLGHPKHPMSDQDVERKFRSLAAGRVHARTADKIIGAIWGFETMKDIREFTALLKVTRDAA